MAALVLVLLGCGDEARPRLGGEPTGAVCPATAPPTYEGFGRAFLDAYCVRCHTRSVNGAQRRGAPDSVNFEDLGDVLSNRITMDRVAAAGPRAVNTAMPPGGPAPSTEERMRLGEWLACEAQLPGTRRSLRRDPQ